MPGELDYMNKNFSTFINGTRTISALFFSFFITGIAFCFLFKKNLNKNTLSFILLIFLINFISQFIGLSLNQDRVFDLNNSYLALYSISTISLLYLIQKLNFDDLIPLMFYFIIIILCFSVIYILYFNLDKFVDTLISKNLYNLIHPDIALFYQAQPRITGLSRTISIINLFLIIIY